MRKKVAIVLVFAMLNWNINILADTENRNSDFIEDFGEMPVETENSVQASNEGAEEKREDAVQSAPDPRPSLEEKTEESTKVPENAEASESIGGLESTEASEGTEVLESTEASKGTEVLESTEASESTKVPEATEENSTETTKADGGEETQGGLLQEGTEGQENVLLAEEQDDMETLLGGRQRVRAEDVVYNVLFPTSTNAYLDPGDWSGRGQIFSDRYEVENYGNTDVAIKIKNIEICYPSTEGTYRFTSDEITDENTIRNINVDMVWENEDGTSQTIIRLTEGIRDEYVLQLKAAEYDEDGILLGSNEGGTGWFYFTGTMDPDLELDWEDEQITVNFYYEIVNPDSVNVLKEGKKAESRQSTPYEAESAKDKEIASQEEMVDSVPAVSDAEKEKLKEDAVESANNMESEEEAIIAESLTENEEDKEEKLNLNVEDSQAAS